MEDGKSKAMSQCYILVNPVIVSSLQVWYAYCVVCTILWTKRGCTLVSWWHSVNSILIKPGVPARGVNYALISIFKRRRLQERRFLNIVGRRGVINYHEASWLDLEVTVSNKLVSLNGRSLHHSCEPWNTVCTVLITVVNAIPNHFTHFTFKEGLVGCRLV